MAYEEPVPAEHGEVNEAYDHFQVVDTPPEYETVETQDEIKAVLRLGSLAKVDSMLSSRKGTLHDEGQQPMNILILQPKTTQQEFAAKYLEGQVAIVEQLKNITNIKIPLGFILHQGFRQPVLKLCGLLLSDHLKYDQVIYENARSKQLYKNLQTPQSGLQAMFNGIANGLAQLHQVGALAYGLNTQSVFVHEENGRLIAKLSSFSEASLVRQRDRLDFEMGERDVRRLAPETIDSLEHNCKSDVWVMAILFWEAISGHQPYKSYTDDIDVQAAIMDGSKQNKPTKCTPQMYDVMMRCWTLNPENRPCASQVARELLATRNI
ncbi:hypothetical protein CAPTEDRAFT_201577 [Capitella teleta]|uniref:Protein kinase domain-containing protein n=1 Tax=Capitella teleta TaxID=283909 RepID=R7T440_CAPTE|nr:hypothetical protein CAPTEDRAFT_201577 [Capitella teleta]|eukprot:ELT87642.1 hypothetical protein CAPTEDRAFT_201577 [Capitella teleta]